MPLRLPCRRETAGAPWPAANKVVTKRTTQFVGLAAEPQEKFSILLVDDDPMVVRILNRILSDFAPVRFATSGHLALKLARESVPDLVILDVDMPEMSGFEVCKTFKSDKALSEVPIIFITSHESVQLEAKGIELGATDFISKPPHAPLVLARVRTYQRLKLLSETMRSAVKMDFLTGAVTRRQWEKALGQEWLRAQRSAAPLAFLLADIESFTSFNTELGEETGDACLKSVADALRSVAHRPTDVLGRYAGGKFAVLLPETDGQGADIVAQRAIETVNGLQIPHAVSGHGSCVTLSVGGVCRDSVRSNKWNGTSNVAPDGMLAAAEHALKCARSAGGQRAIIVDIVNFDGAQALSLRNE
jgi:diguanylate cyclase (GGDEF)-like protein